MKCDKCGFTPNPGDQICMNCGAKLSSDNATILGVDAFRSDKEKEKKNNMMILIFTILGIIILAIIIFLVIKYVVL